MRTSITADPSFAPPFPKLVSVAPVCLLLLFSISCSTGQNNSADGLAETPSDSTLVIRNAWLRPGTRGMTSGGYLTIYNGKATADTLKRVTTAGARSTEVHESFQNEEGVSGMRPAGTLPIQPGARLQLKPGGYHLMLMQLNRDLTVGDTLSLTFFFAESDSIKVHIPVKKN